MSNFFARRGAAYMNEMKQSCGALLGIATGLLSDKQLSDAEIAFLNDWLEQHAAISTMWPGDVVHSRVKATLADGVVSEAERDNLVETLQLLIGGTFDELASPAHVTQLAFDEVQEVAFPQHAFCLTGEFVYGPRSKCEAEVVQRGGTVKSSVSKKLKYLVVGGLGSPEWKHGSFGTKIDSAMKLKRQGADLCILHEESWTKAL